MKRPAVVVLLLTFVALVAAALWVPCTKWIQSSGSGLHWVPVWTATRQGMTQWAPRYEVEWKVLALEYAVIIGAGGLLALALRLRSQRQLATDSG